MSVKINFLASLLLFSAAACACGGIGFQVYSGEIKYELNAFNPYFCEATITLVFDVNQNPADDSIIVNWGDGNIGEMYAKSVTADTAANAVVGTSRYYAHIYSGKHRYDSTATAVFYPLSVMGQVRVNYSSNIYGGSASSLPFYLGAMVGINIPAGNMVLPVLSAPYIGLGALDTFNQAAISLLPNPGDSIYFDLITPLMDTGSPVPAYLFPDQFCQAHGAANSLFTINHQTGQISWITPCVQGLFDIAVEISVYRNGQLLGSFMRDEIIYVSGQLSGVKQFSPVADLKLYPNPVSDNLLIDMGEQISSKTVFYIVTPEGGVIMPLTGWGRNLSIDISGLAPGIYFLLAKNDGQSVIKRFIKI